MRKSGENSEAGMSKTYSDRVYGIFRSRTISVLSLKFPCHPLFESCICSWGTAARMNLENRSPISRAFRGGRGCGDGDLERFVRKT